MDVFNKIALSIAMSVFLISCGGGGGSTASPTPITPTPIPPNTLSATVEIQPTVKDIQKQWATGVNIVDNDTLTFAGNPKLAKGEVFVVQGKAYKVEAVGGSVAATEVTVSEPALSDIYKKIEISGKTDDYADFIPEPVLLQAVSQQAVAAMTITVDEIKKERKYQSDGFRVTEYSLQATHKSGVQLQGKFSLGMKSEFKAWSPINQAGSGHIDLFLTPEIKILLEKTAESQPVTGSCNSATPHISKVLQGATIARYRLGTLSIPTTVPSFRVNIPVCASFTAKATAAFELLELSGNFTSQISLGNNAPPQIITNNNLQLETPSKSAIVPQQEVDGAVIREEVEIEGTVALETSIEAEGAFGLLRTGVMLSAAGTGELTGTTAALAVGTNFEDVVAKPEVCLMTKGKLSFTGSLYAEAGWNRPKLSLVISPNISYEHELFDKQYGLCECPTGGYWDAKNIFPGNYRLRSIDPETGAIKGYTDFVFASDYTYRTTKSYAYVDNVVSEWDDIRTGHWAYLCNSREISFLFNADIERRFPVDTRSTTISILEGYTLGPASTLNKIALIRQ